MKILYIANVRIPTEKAHGFAIMKMCEAMGKAGNEVKLVIPWRLNHIDADPYAYYGVENTFTIRRLPSIDLVTLLGRLGFLIESISFAISALFCSLFF